MLTPTDKQIVAEYMGWKLIKSGQIVDKQRWIHQLDSNDASLCVEKMVEKGDFDNFISHVWTTVGMNGINYVKYLFNADNFFQALASWLRSKK